MQNRPNVLIFFADQMRADSLGCAGHPVVKTPNIDRLAAEGARFINAGTPTPVCIPARACLATGILPHRSCASKANSGTVASGIATLAGTFTAAGYRTYASGKLHYSPYAPPGKPRLLYGFEKASLAESGRILGLYDPQGKQRGLEEYHDYLTNAGWGGYSRAHGVGNNDIHPAPSPLPAEHYVDSWVATRALEYLDEHKKNSHNDPFLLYLGFPKPHAPYDPPRPWDTLYDPRTVPPPLADADGTPRVPEKETERITHGWNFVSPETIRVIRSYYYAQIAFQDFQIGRVLTQLEKDGQLDNTIILYGADHGEMLGDFGFFAKSCFYRASVNVPFIMRWPAGIKAGLTSDALAGIEDIMPTLCGLTEIKLKNAVDGLDLSPVLAGTNKELRSYYVSYYAANDLSYMISNREFKYIYGAAGAREELYNLQKDPHELKNCAAEPACAAVITELRGALAGWAKKYDDDDFADGKFPVRPALDADKSAFQAESMGWRWY